MKVKVKFFINFIIIVCVFLIVFFEIQTTYSKYAQTIEITGITGVANPHFSLNQTSKIEIDALSSEVFNYEFSVQNFEEENVSENLFKYFIEFELSQKNAPIIINLYKKANSTEEKVEMENYKTVNFESMSMEEKEAIFYRVEFYYDNASDNLLEPNFTVSLKIEAVQEEA